MVKTWLSKKDIIERRNSYIKSNDKDKIAYCDRVLFTFAKIEHDLKEEQIIAPLLTYSLKKFKLNSAKKGEVFYDLIDIKVYNNKEDWFTIDDIENTIKKLESSYDPYKDYIDSYKQYKETIKYEEKCYKKCQKFNVVFDKITKLINVYKKAELNIEITFNSKYDIMKLRNIDNNKVIFEHLDFCNLMVVKNI